MKLQELLEKELPTVPLFHLTVIRDAISIIKTKRFILTPHTIHGFDITKSEESKSAPIKYYFLSTARSPRSAYIEEQRGNGSVLLVLNKNRLNANNKINSHVDSGADTFGDEMEDRVFNKTNILPIRSPINNTITQIRVIAAGKPPTQGTIAYTPETLKELQLLCKENNIPFKVFDTESKFLSGR